MGIFDRFRLPDINQGVREFREDPGGILLDVRSPGEYRQGHIPGSENLPLDTIDNVELLVENKDTILYVYCRSGARSRQAVSLLRDMGYGNARNIGGILAYTGKVEG